MNKTPFEQCLEPTLREFDLELSKATYRPDSDDLSGYQFTEKKYGLGWMYARERKAKHNSISAHHRLLIPGNPQIQEASAKELEQMIVDAIKQGHTKEELHVKITNPKSHAIFIVNKDTFCMGTPEYSRATRKATRLYSDPGEITFFITKYIKNQPKSACSD